MVAAAAATSAVNLSSPNLPLASGDSADSNNTNYRRSASTSSSSPHNQQSQQQQQQPEQQVEQAPKLVRRQLFPEKLWEIVNRPASGISWSPDGKRIEVERDQFEKHIGTKFRSSNFDSFIRQLHFYGFRKCGNSYHHDKFQRGRPEGLLSMKRKYSTALGDGHEGDSQLASMALSSSNKNSITHRSETPSSSFNDSSSSDSSFERDIDQFEQQIQHINSQHNILEEVLDLSESSKRKRVRTKEIHPPPPAPPVIQPQSLSVDLVDSQGDHGYVIDYTQPSKRSAANNRVTKSHRPPISRSPMKIVNNESSIVTREGSSIQMQQVDNKKLAIYTLNPSFSMQQSSLQKPGKQLRSFGENFTLLDVRRDFTEVRKRDNTISIAMPELMKSSASSSEEKIAWPKTLVLQSYFNGDNNIMSAYFIYKSSEAQDD